MEHPKHIVASAIAEAFTEVFQSQLEPGEVYVEYTEAKFGDFASNIALKMAAKLNKSPLEISKSLAKVLKTNEVFDDVQIAGPGFINMRLQAEIYLKYVQSIYQDTLLHVKGLGNSKKMIIDYSHPNIGKPMGVHHLLSTIIGDSIKLIYRGVGYEVVADNFIGDMGTQFGKLIHAVKTWGDMDAIEKDPISELLKLYVQFHVSAESDDSLDDAGRAEYKKLEEGDKTNRELLKKIQGWSMAEILALYDQLNIEFDYFNGESFYEDKIHAIIELGKEKGIFVESQGALVCKLDNPDEPPAIIQKSDGTSLYLTRDLARVAYWDKTWKPDLMVNVVDVAQSLQLRQVYEVSDKLGLTKAKNVHVAFGRMQFSEGGMSTRKGNIILVEEVLAEVRRRANEQVASLSKGLTKLEQDELAEILAINAVKYTILRQNRVSNLVFDWNNLLSLEGNSAPYLAYSLVRMSAIARDTEAANTSDISTGKLDDAEKSLLLEITKFDDMVMSAVNNYQPSDIANYCYNLCRMYNGFYHTHKIIEDDDIHSSRLLINNATLRVVQSCFDLLGLKAPNKM